MGHKGSKPPPYNESEKGDLPPPPNILSEESKIGIEKAKKIILEQIKKIDSLNKTIFFGVYSFEEKYYIYNKSWVEQSGYKMTITNGLVTISYKY